MLLYMFSIVKGNVLRFVGCTPIGAVQHVKCEFDICFIDLPCKVWIYTDGSTGEESFTVPEPWVLEG